MPNEGVKWTPDRQFAEIRRIETEHPWLKGREITGVADPAIWDASRGESVAQTAARYGVYFTPGDNERIAGWMQCITGCSSMRTGTRVCMYSKTAKHLSGRCR